MTGIMHLMMDDLRLFDFPIYHTFDVILGHISFSVEIYRSSWSHMILITHEMHVELIVYCYLIMTPPVESLFGHPVKLALFDI